MPGWDVHVAASGLLFFLRFIYSFERERAHMSRGRGRENLEQTPC